MTSHWALRPSSRKTQLSFQRKRTSPSDSRAGVRSRTQQPQRLCHDMEDRRLAAPHDGLCGRARDRLRSRRVAGDGIGRGAFKCRDSRRHVCLAAARRSTATGPESAKRRGLLRVICTSRTVAGERPRAPSWLGLQEQFFQPRAQELPISLGGSVDRALPTSGVRGRGDLGWRARSEQDRRFGSDWESGRRGGLRRRASLAVDGPSHAWRANERVI